MVEYGAIELSPSRVLANTLLLVRSPRFFFSRLPAKPSVLGATLYASVPIGVLSLSYGAISLLIKTKGAVLLSWVATFWNLSQAASMTSLAIYFFGALLFGCIGGTFLYLVFSSAWLIIFVLLAGGARSFAKSIAARASLAPLAFPLSFLPYHPYFHVPWFIYLLVLDSLAAIEYFGAPKTRTWIITGPIIALVGGVFITVNVAVFHFRHRIDNGIADRLVYSAYVMRQTKAAIGNAASAEVSRFEDELIQDAVKQLSREQLEYLDERLEIQLDSWGERTGRDLRAEVDAMMRETSNRSPPNDAPGALPAADDFMALYADLERTFDPKIADLFAPDAKIEILTQDRHSRLSGEDYATLLRLKRRSHNQVTAIPSIAVKNQSPVEDGFEISFERLLGDRRTETATLIISSRTGSAMRIISYVSNRNPSPATREPTAVEDSGEIELPRP
jgi:hypothetical protein